mgnify:FL=1
MFNTIEEEREWRAAYSRDRYRRLMAKVVAHLGWRCVVCGTTDDLQTHHIDPKAKEFTISTIHSWPWPVVLKELEKCELRCVEHHKEIHAPKHGTISCYRNRKCRCDSCREAWNAKTREWKAAWKAKKSAHVTPGATNVE